MNRYAMFGAALALTCGALLGACADLEESTPVETMDSAQPAAAAPPATAEKNRYVVVQRGQSLGRIAKTYHVPEQAIIAANDLAPPYHLKPGMRIAIPTASPSETKSTTGTKETSSEPALSRAASRPQREIEVPAKPAQSRQKYAEPEVIALDDPAPRPPASQPAGVASDRGKLPSLDALKADYGLFGLDPALSR